MEAARKATTLSKDTFGGNYSDNFVFYLAEIYAHFGDTDLAFETMQKLIRQTDRRRGVRGSVTTRSDLGPDSQGSRFEKAIASLADKESR